MARDFTPPAITTKDNMGAVTPEFAFVLRAKFDAVMIEKTAHGERIFQNIVSGTIDGSGLGGEVYPDSGGNYGVIRLSDGVEDVEARFMLRAANGEWLYTSHVGYRRPDGYYRFQAGFDADAGGPYAWLNDAVMIGTATLDEDGCGATFTYFQAL